MEGWVSPASHFAVAAQKVTRCTPYCTVRCEHPPVMQKRADALVLKLDGGIIAAPKLNFKTMSGSRTTEDLSFSLSFFSFFFSFFTVLSLSCV